jgi:hypothetical protein
MFSLLLLVLRLLFLLQGKFIYATGLSLCDYLLEPALIVLGSPPRDSRSRVPPMASTSESTSSPRTSPLRPHFSQVNRFCPIHSFIFH